MSKRAEEKAKEYANKTILSVNHRGDVNDAFLDGYEEAEQDTIEKAIAWLKEHASNYIVNRTESYPDAPFKAIVGGMCWEDLREYMEEDECQDQKDQ